MDYQQGLAALKKLAEGSDWFADVSLYEARLLENLDQERRYGSSEQYRVTRAQIVDQLNRLAYAHVKMSFNDLCRGALPQVPNTSAFTPDPAPGSQRTKQQRDTERGTTSDLARTNVFIGFSQQDSHDLADLHIHLKPYVRSGVLKVWDNTMIPPGARWHEEHMRAIQAAKVAILLISAHFLASDYIVNTELPLLLKAAEQGRIKILCVILSHCNFGATDLARFQPVNAPSRPLSVMTPGQRDEVWMQVAKYACDILQE
ncbi:MAG: toll/interleukin-1 receptor domain-containing protein [Chloroflexota bacterium]|nr:toll/interleukin-1 receptor domain-containing protein [Chloroflexota bacterium]